ncbi:hypothetical protein [Microbacterium invictum]|uniref:GGDEF domain-containing protein n=1 Tax=Microbacterium invictum TaxID=515415 RepID=A0AA40VM58_9MICO|nr:MULTISPECIES: hypothetical protein [Microbacterium]MBB4139339.1 hypothetical protein [Microbacterium invictum]
MTIDAFTVNMLVAIVTMTAGTLYLLETMLRREVGPGRVWALGFLSGMLTVVAYLLWQGTADPWVAIAIGNAALVSTLGCFWLGCRSFNAHRVRPAGAVVGAVAIVQLVVTLAAGPDGGDWAGAVLLFFGVAVFAGLASVESRRAGMGAIWSSLGFTIVFAFVAAYYFVRAIVLWVEGPEGSLFTTWFNSSITGIVSIVLTIVALTTATMLRTGRVTVRQDAEHATLQVTPAGVLSAPSFETAVGSVLSRARGEEASCAVASVRMDDLAQIGVAFGTVEEESIATQWHTGIRRYAPVFALVGDGDEASVLIAWQPASPGDARRVAGRIQRRLLDDFAERGSAVIPAVGVGIAFSDDVGYDPGALIDAAQDAARRSSTSPDASVIVAEAGDDRAAPIRG